MKINAPRSGRAGGETRMGDSTWSQWEMPPVVYIIVNEHIREHASTPTSTPKNPKIPRKSRVPYLMEGVSLRVNIGA